jgi:hypothetical protein
MGPMGQRLAVAGPMQQAVRDPLIGLMAATRTDIRTENKT